MDFNISIAFHPKFVLVTVVEFHEVLSLLKISTNLFCVTSTKPGSYFTQIVKVNHRFLESHSQLGTALVVRVKNSLLHEPSFKHWPVCTLWWLVYVYFLFVFINFLFVIIYFFFWIWSTQKPKLTLANLFEAKMCLSSRQEQSELINLDYWLVLMDNFVIKWKVHNTLVTLAKYPCDKFVVVLGSRSERNGTFYFLVCHKSSLDSFAIFVCVKISHKCVEVLIFACCMFLLLWKENLFKWNWIHLTETWTMP